MTYRRRRRARIFTGPRERPPRQATARERRQLWVWMNRALGFRLTPQGWERVVKGDKFIASEFANADTLGDGAVTETLLNRLAVFLTDGPWPTVAHGFTSLAFQHYRVEIFHLCATKKLLAPDARLEIFPPRPARKKSRRVSRCANLQR